MAAVDLNPVISATIALEESLKNSLTQIERNALVKEHIENFDSSKHITVPPFQEGLDWINTCESLKLDEHLKNKIVILDFFTYCCINCMHVLPSLQRIEEKYSASDGVIVVGVHSAKFDNERILENVVSAVQRYGIRHPVVNDTQAVLWNELSIMCWPTLLILGPDNQVLFVLMGEGHGDFLNLSVQVALEHFSVQGRISNNPIPISLFKRSLFTDCLSFPGKISIDPNEQFLAISDTGHHRIVITTISGVVQNIIGGLDSGFQDGSFSEAKFFSPQGIVWFSSSIIYVADTENHAIRQIDLVEYSVKTVAGTGLLGTDKEGGKLGLQQDLSSPWDLCIDYESPEILYIAMAGLHQLWMYFLQDSKWLKDSFYCKETCLRLAGSGREENKNNNYPHSASFAQPSGVCHAKILEKPCLLVADSESSAIRMISLSDGRVMGLVGGDRDPLNLFAFGDQDGVGIDAKLQHPLGITWNQDDGLIYVADSYNHKIKIVDINSKSCRTLAGSGRAGNVLSSDLLQSEFNEPSGLCISTTRKELYIADTNNNNIKILNLTSLSIQELPLEWKVESVAVTEGDRCDGLPLKPRPKSHILIPLSCVQLCCNSAIKFKFNLSLQQQLKLTEEAPQSWKICLPGYVSDFLTVEPASGSFQSLEDQPSFLIMVQNLPRHKQNEKINLEIEASVYFCNSTGCCFMKIIVFQLPIIISDKGEPSGDQLLSFTILQN